MFLNLITEILFASTPQIICCCYHRQSCKKFCFHLQSIFSKLSAELDLSNSKSKTHSKSTHSIEEIVQGNISYCKKFNLNITELNKSLPIMYRLPNIHETPVGARFIVASYYCTNNPISDTISKIFKMIFNTVERFHKNVSLIQTVRKSGLFRILFRLSLC